MAYIYCSKCNEGNDDEPTLRQLIDGTYSCWSCGQKLPPRENVMGALLDRIEELEEKVRELSEK